MQTLYELIKDKVFFSCISGKMVTVVEKLPEEGKDGEVYFDGVMLLDCADECFEDDIQQVWTYTKDGEEWNLEDYYDEYGAFDEDGSERFAEALDNLMTVHEYMEE